MFIDPVRLGHTACCSLAKTLQEPLLMSGILLQAHGLSHANLFWRSSEELTTVHPIKAAALQSQQMKFW